MTTWLRCASFGASGVLGMIVTASLFAQEGAAPPPAPVEAPRPSAKPSAAVAGEDDSILTLTLKSGVSGVGFMVVLGLFSLVGTTVAIERAFNTRRSRIIPQPFVSELQRLVRSRDARPEDYLLLCSRSNAPVSGILRAGLLRCGRPIPEVEKAMEDAAAREMAGFRGRIRPLSVVGSVAPLVGLLGTVLGMIVAFRTASQAGLGKGELMAQGIYLALLTTAAGLMIAIPSLVCAALFSSKVDKLFREIDEQLMETIPWFVRMERADRINEDARALDEPIREPATALT